MTMPTFQCPACGTRQPTGTTLSPCAVCGAGGDRAQLTDRVRAAIYTEERALWLDPEDLDAIVSDVVAAVTTR